jgi:CubicO group peptidase (beta-lactamase class C family)
MDSSSFRFAFNKDESNYEFTLVRSDAAKKAITVGGVTYTIQAADPDKESTILHIISCAETHDVKDMEELAGHLKRIPNVHNVQVTTTEKVHSVATATLTIKQELLVTPGVPAPNTEVRPMSIEERMHDLGVPGVSIAIINGDTITQKSFGVLNQPKVTSQAASISKVVTALTVLSIIQDPSTVKKKIDLKTPISTLLDTKILDHIDPTGLYRDKITLRHLLQHTSGIVLRDKSGNQVTGFQGYPCSEEELDKEIKELEDLGQKLNDAQKKHLEYLHANREAILGGKLPSLDDILYGKETANSGSILIEMPPDSRCSYSGANTLLLQKILEDVSGKTFETLVQEQVFTPLKLSEQTTYHPDEQEVASGHEITSAPVSGGRHAFPELAAAGLYTTASDLARIAVEIQNALSGKAGTIISQELAKEMVAQQATGKGPPCGLGVFVEKFEGVTYFIHPGSNRGFQNFFIANDRGQGACVLTNSDNGEHLWEEIIKSIAIRKWKDADKLPFCRPKIKAEQVSKETPKNEEWIQPFEGVYTAERGLQFSLRLEKGNIIGELSGETPFIIHPIGPQTAIYRRFTPGPYEVLEFTPHENSIQTEISGAVLIR